jgi:hypothetical protein
MYYYSLYCPSHPEFVRDHLNSGVLERMIKEQEVKILAPPTKWTFMEDPCYGKHALGIDAGSNFTNAVSFSVYVLLGACAMTLGCQLPDAYVSMLKKVYTEGGLMRDALKQMRKALFGPDGFKNGVPYDFESKDLVETANSMDEKKSAPSSLPWIGMNVMSPGGIFNTGMGNSTTSLTIKELRAKHNNPEACGSCGVKIGKGGKPLLQCARCKDRKYCGAECQKKHWKIHKKVCDPVTGGK